jgi:hypothetical protein
VTELTSEEVKHMFSINRSKTWIIPKFAGEFAPEGPAAMFSETQKSKWESNKSDFLGYRKQVESAINASFELSRRNSPLQKWAFENFGKTMRERLGNNEELIKKIGRSRIE